MRSFKHASLALALAIGFSGAAQAQTVGYNVRTGDVWLDNRIGEVNDYGTRYREPFINELNSNYGAPRSLLTDLLTRRGWSPGDVYTACAIARAANVPCDTIVRDYERDRGQGWGALAMSRGIKPGSPAFHAMKRGTVATYDRWGYPITVGSNTRVDWSKDKKSKAGKGKVVAGTQHRMSDVEHRKMGHDATGHGKDKGAKNKGGNGGKDKGGNGKGNGKG